LYPGIFSKGDGDQDHIQKEGKRGIKIHEDAF
jgi:hypothetical protein